MFDSSKEVYTDEAKFTHDGKTYFGVGTITHNMKLEDYGIGSYEFWGMRGVDKKMRHTSHFEDADFDGVEVYIDGSVVPIDNPSEELIDLAKLAMYSSTYEQAEESADLE